MGVPGLTTFINKNNHILVDFKLHDNKIIVDGNNLLHHIYYRYKIGVDKGGEYLQFYDCCKHFFEPFLQCCISVFIIFDGAYDRDGRKFETALNRDKNKVLEYIKIANGIEVNSQVLPLFASKVFNNALKDIGISKVTCLTEADHCIAGLAKEWNCPILTNDSDFFIYDLPAGVILIDYLDLNVVKGHDFSYLTVPIYFCAEFKKWAKIKDDDLALLATLLGNDLVNSKQFNKFFDRKSCIFGKKQEKIKGLIDWLSSKASTNSAISEILTCINFQNHEKVNSVILKSIEEYSKPNVSYTSLHFQNNHTIDSCICLSYFLDIVPFITPPLAFLFINHELPIKLLEILTNSRLISMCQIEQAREVSTQVCSLALRRVIYGSIANTLKNANNLIVEYKRVGNELVKEIVRPYLENAAGSRAFSFDEIARMELLERQIYVIESLIGSLMSPVNSFNDNLFYTCVLCYWYNTIKPSEALLQAILLMLFTQPKSMKVEKYDIGADSNVATNFGMSYRLKWDNFSKENLTVVKSVKNFAYQFCQFQSCLQAADYLNGIFLMPFSPNICFNGSLLSCVYQYLEIYKASGLDKILCTFSDIRNELQEALSFIRKHSQVWEVKHQGKSPKFKTEDENVTYEVPKDTFESFNQFSIIDD